MQIILFKWPCGQDQELYDFAASCLYQILAKFLTHLHKSFKELKDKMPISYPILYKRNQRGKVVCVYFPDLKYEVDISEQDEEPINLDDFASKILLEHLTSLKSQNLNIPYPKKLAEYKKQREYSSDFWSKISIDFEFNKGFFEKFLPKFGLFSTITTALTMAFIYFSAILITSGTTPSSLIFTVIGVICATTMAVIIYHYSDAGKLSMQLGKLIDDASTYLSNYRDIVSCATNQLPRNRHSTAIILAKLAVTAIPVTASTFSSVGHYREIKTMGEKISDDQVIFKDAYFLVNDVMIIFSMYSLLTFQISFLPHVYKYIDQLFNSSENNTLTNLPLDEPRQESQEMRDTEKTNLLLESDEPTIEGQGLSSLQRL